MSAVNEFLWHNAIDGSSEINNIVEQAEFCLSIAKMLKEGVEQNIIAISGSDSQPSLTMWDVVDHDKYEEICKTHELDPDDFAVIYDET
jgi:hypothetical protein